MNLEKEWGKHSEMDDKSRYITGHEKIEGGYYKIPKQLFSERYKNLSLEAKFLYVIMRDLTDFSLQNKWIDERGNLYIMLSASKMARYAGCSERKARDLKKELIRHNLIDSVTPKIGLPSRLYILKVEVSEDSLTHAEFAQEPVQDLQETHAEFAQEPVQDLHTINNNIINNNISITNNQEEVEDTSYLDIGTPPPPTPQQIPSDFSQFVTISGLNANNSQIWRLLDYVGFDAMELELVKLAVTKTVDQGIRSPAYTFKILDKWKAKGFTKLEQGLQEQKEFEASKANADKSNKPSETKIRFGIKGSKY